MKKTKPGVKFSKADFDVFKARCRYWLDFFGITGWEVQYLFTQIDSIAQCDAQDEDMNAVFTLTRELEICADILNQNKLELLDGCARHEVLELLLMQLWFVAQKGRARLFGSREFKARFNQDTHAVIHRIDAALDRAGLTTYGRPR